MGAIVLGIAMFMFLVVIHELGHFFAAKKSGVHVHEFGVGIPPKVTKLWKDKAGTEYTINWIPLGGFVRLKGEDPSDPETFFAKDSFITASLFNKIVILLGGVFINALFARIAFSVVFFIGTKPITVIPDGALATQSRSYLMPSLSFLQEKGLVEQTSASEGGVPIGTVMEGGIAEELGIVAGSTILTINGSPVDSTTIGTRLQEAIGGPLLLEVRLPDSDEVVLFESVCPAESCLLGVGVSGSTLVVDEIKMDFFDAFGAGLHEMKAQTTITLNALGTLGKNLLSFNKQKISGSVDQLSGPVGIVAFGQQLFYNQGWIGYLGFTGIISLALALFNILPIPALDGGRIVSVLIQAIGRFAPSKYFVIENYINILFFALLMIFGLFIIYKDIIMVNALYG